MIKNAQNMFYQLTGVTCLDVFFQKYKQKFVISIIIYTFALGTRAGRNAGNPRRDGSCVTVRCSSLNGQPALSHSKIQKDVQSTSFICSKFAKK